MHILQNWGQSEFNFRFHAKWNGAGVRDSCLEMRVYLRPRRLKAEEAQGPPSG
ncbi:hypothetical protein [Peribacillus muralis]|uniref:hypothetical protein n=1 Tax=Peribacillus muralis TaxID=264697 RepID=UPI00366FB32D